jgi:hypothetical protein
MDLHGIGTTSFIFIFLGIFASDALMIFDTNQHEDLQIIQNALTLGLRNYSIRHGSKEIINFYKFLQDLLHCAQNTVILLEIESKKVLWIT